MILIYDLLFIISVLWYLPVYAFKRKFHRGFLMRLGFLPPDIKNKLGDARPIWLHAVSVGEVNALRLLLKGLHKEYPHTPLIISTVTPTGNAVAASIARKEDLVFYLPLDISAVVRYVVKIIRPALFIIAETEIWPNLISCLYKNKVPMAIVNARISDKSFRKYRVIKFCLAPILNKIAQFCVQTNTDALRLRELGVGDEKIMVTGNMKFDTTDYAESPSEKNTGYADYRKKLGLNEDDKLFVAGSTHPGEEEKILWVYKELLKEFGNLKLLLAPRHPRRTQDIERLVLNNDFKAMPISQLGRIRLQAQRTTVFILDTIGQLLPFYAISGLVFVGGSLIKKGGQNLLEPAAFAKPVLFGPYMFNFRDIARIFIENKACVLVRDREELLDGVKGLLRNPSKMTELGARARQLILQNQGATERNLECIRKIALVL
jgi:3-deoxy-D-manno-octulosonic-acid transferase